MKMTLIFTASFLVVTLQGQAQSLTKHQWKNRVLIVLTDDSNDILYSNQIKELESDIKGLHERKLVIYKVSPKNYSVGLKVNDFIDSDLFYKQYKRSSTSFEIILIGLDGGVKLRQSGLLTLKELFAIIDAMPMRANEIRQKKKNNN
ncbi:MAG: DUF4174 domain-containing protein [Flavobacteriaceae bacterium]|nr:DUF4174 domain-containing protein [Flavobacteriaceae bacterium]